MIDTNHASAFMGNLQPVTAKIAQLAEQGERFYLCVPTIGELYFAVYASSRQRENLVNLRRLLARIAVLPYDVDAAREYGRVRTELKQKGRPIPGVDAQIAAVARLHGLTVLSADRHFTHVNALAVENWL